jgi:hypothetical protein
MKADGGMSGDTLDERVLSSIRALATILKSGRPFASHAQALREFLKSQTLNPEAEALWHPLEERMHEGNKDGFASMLRRWLGRSSKIPSHRI